MRTVYKRLPDGQLVDPKQLELWVPTINAMFVKLGHPMRPVYVYQDVRTTQLFCEAQDVPDW